MPTLALQLLTFHEEPKVLEALFASLVAQTNRDWNLYWLDSGSSEDEREAMRRIGAPFQMIVAEKNLGFSGGHEYLYHQHSADYVFCVNADAILESDYIERLRAYLDDHPSVGAVSGSIFRWSNEGGGVERSMIIDSLGLARTRWHKVYDIGAGLREDQQARRPVVQVFGVSGCLPMYRRAAVGPMLFDPLYFLYKEDVDLAYRLQRAQWGVAIVPGATAYHLRTFRPSLLHIGVPWQKQWLSYRNHLRNLRRHLTWKDWLRDGWAIVPFEFLKAWYILYKYALRHRHRDGEHQ